MDKMDIKKQKVIEALDKTLGIISHACKMVKLSRTTFYKWMETDPEFAQKVREIEENTLDFVESKLFEQIEQLNTSATIFYLKTKGKKRGYIERKEITGAEGTPIQGIDVDKLPPKLAMELLKHIKGESTSD